MANLVQLLCLFSLLAGVELVCMDGWVRHHDSCYELNNMISKTWLQAYMDCQSKGSHLVRINSVEENDFIKRELAKLSTTRDLQFWTAGNDIVSEGVWVWGLTSDRVTTSFWAPREPNQVRVEDDCMTFKTLLNFGWNDEHCELPYFFICEHEDPVSEVVG